LASPSEDGGWDEFVEFMPNPALELTVLSVTFLVVRTSVSDLDLKLLDYQLTPAVKPYKHPDRLSGKVVAADL
jgi:hypothetical protein